MWTAELPKVLTTESSIWCRTLRITVRPCYMSATKGLNWTVTAEDCAWRTVHGAQKRQNVKVMRQIIIIG